MGRSRRRLPTALLAVIVVAPLGIFAWQTATADQSPDQVRLSADGARWGADVEDSFFRSEKTWEPGEARTAILWVRNDAPVPAAITLTVTSPAGEALVRDGVLVVSAAVEDGHPVRLGFEESASAVGGMTLEPGESAPLTLRAQPASGLSEAQVSDISDVRFRVVGSGRALADQSGSLPAVTRSRLILAPVFIGLALVVTAVVMTRRASRDKTTPHL